MALHLSTFAVALMVHGGSPVAVPPGFWICEANISWDSFDISCSIPVCKANVFVLLVLVNGDVGDFHDDGSFTHGEPGARIFGGLRRQSCNAKKKPLHVFLFDRIQSRFVTFCGISFAWYIWIHLMYDLTFLTCVLENDLYSKHFACFGVFF